MKIKYLYLLVLTITFLLTACKDDFPVQQTEYSISFKDIPSLVSFQSNKPIFISAKIYPYTFTDLNKVKVWLEASLNEQIVLTDTLYDDGLINENGDIVQYDGIFSTLIPVENFSEVGNYSIKISYEIGDKVKAVEQDMSIINNQKPEILSAVLPDSIFETDMVFSITFNDDDGLEDLDSFKINIFQDDNFQNIFKSLNYSLDEITAQEFLLQIDSTFGAGFIGNKWFRIVVYDIIETDTLDVEEPIYIVNSAPWLSNVILPDSATIPETGQNLIYISTRANDKRGQADIAEVYFMSEENKINLFDDGDYQIHGDVTVDDGVYSQIIATNAGNIDSTYIFNFYTKDKVGQESPVVQKQITVYHP